MSDYHFYCLRFKNRGQAARVFYRLGLTNPVHDDGRAATFHDGDWYAQNPPPVLDENGNPPQGYVAEQKLAGIGKLNFPVALPHRMCADEIGLLYHPTGATTTDPDTGLQVPVMAVSDGWHVNVGVKGRALRKKLRPWVVKPAMQKREFAGERAAMDASRDDIAREEMLGMDTTDAQMDAISEA